MSLASYILSLCLHIAVILMLWFWPTGKPLVNLEKPVLISLVDGAPGGNNLPSPILGPTGEEATGEKAPTPSAERAEVAASERQATQAVPIKAPDADRPMKQEVQRVAEPQPKPKPKPEPPKQDAVPTKKAEPKPKPKPKPKEPEKKEEKKEPPKKKPEPKKEPVKKTERKDKETAGKDKKDAKSSRQSRDSDAVKAALEQAKRKATSRAESGDRGSSVQQALAQARKNAGGNRGGGGGSGDGPGGGGLHAAYIGMVMQAVKPNWGYASASRANLRCLVHIQVDASGKVTSMDIISSSGNAQYDASCVNAIRRTSQAGDFPPPPSSEYQALDIVFTLSDLRG